MKKNNILLIFFIALLTGSNICNAQKDTKTDPRFDKFMDKVNTSKGIQSTPNLEKTTSNHFYKTYQDYGKKNT
jgi:hypothetical protein